QNPALLAHVDHLIFGEQGCSVDPAEIVARMIPYIEVELGKGERLSAITRHMVGLVQGVPGARAFRRYLTEAAIRPGGGGEVRAEALAFLRPAEAMIPILAAE